MMINGGLSFLTHLIIIGVYRLRYLLHRKFGIGSGPSRSVKSGTFRGAPAVSLFVVLFVAVIACLTIVRVVQGAITSGESNYALLVKLLNNSNEIQNESLDHDIKTTNDETIPIKQSVPIVYRNCEDFYSKEGLTYSWSIVNYLEQQGISSSFRERANLAASFGIVGYRGSAEQNRALLYRLLVDKSELPENCSLISIVK